MRHWADKDDVIYLGLLTGAMTATGLVLGVEAHGPWQHLGLAAFYSANCFVSLQLKRFFVK